MLAKTKRWMLGSAPLVLVAMLVLTVAPLVAQTQPAAPQTSTSHAGGEANLILPDLSQVSFMGVDGRSLLMVGILISALGMLFGLLINRQLKNMPVHSSMLRDFRAHLRDVQDLPDSAGQVPDDPVALHRRHRHVLLRLAGIFG